MDQKVTKTPQTAAPRTDKDGRSVRYVGVAGLPDGTKRIALGSGVITGLLSRGGSAYVYEIWNSQLEVSRAVKLLHPDGLEETKERFETEVKITAKLHHPNIVEIYVVGNWNGLPYIEMERVDGITLEQLIAKRGAISVEVCTAIGIMVARALEYAHNQRYMIYGREYKGIIHRDLKPGNVMLARDGQIKLMDFGIAKPVAGSASDTSDGIVVGTMQYLAPEQLQGGVIDVRADLYSFGAVMYELLTGTRTFPEKNLARLVTDKLSNRFQPLSKFKVTMPSRLRNLAQRCLNYQKEKRLQSAADLLRELEAIHHSVCNQQPEQTLKSYVQYADDTRTVLDTRWLVPHLSTIIQAVGLLCLLGGGGIVAYQIHRALHAGPRIEAQAPVDRPGLSPRPTASRTPVDTAEAAGAWKPIPPTPAVTDTKPTVPVVQRPVTPVLAAAAGPLSSGSHSVRPVVQRPENGRPVASPGQQPSTAADPSQNADLRDRLSSIYGTTDVFTLVTLELKANHVPNALKLLSYLDATTAQTPKAQVFRLRVLEAGGDASAFESFVLSQDVPDAEFYLSKALYFCDKAAPEKAKAFYDKGMKTPGAFLAPVALEERRMLCRARVATAFYQAQPSASSKKEAMDSWYEIKLRLQSTPDHRLYQEADAQIRRIGG